MVRGSLKSGEEQQKSAKAVCCHHRPQGTSELPFTPVKRDLSFFGGGGVGWGGGLKFSEPPDSVWTTLGLGGGDV